jgi:hypothetical protein
MDLYLDYNGDLVLAQDGIPQVATNWDQVRQRILRRMLTNPSQTLPSGVKTQADYIFHQDFGFGMGALVDGDFTQGFLEDLKNRISRAVFSDVDVAPSIPPTVKFNRPNLSTLWIIIGVTLVTGLPGQISIKVTR